MNNKPTKELVEYLLSANDQRGMLDILKALLTPAELEDITRRLQIVKLLKAGVPQRDIAGKLKVGIATVTRGSREIKLGRFEKV